MSNIMQGFLWTRGDTFVHRLDPRSKMVWFTSVFILSIFHWDPIILFLVLFSVVLFAFEGKVIKKWLLTLKSLIVFLVIVVSLEVIYYGLFFGLIATLKFILMTSAFSIFFLTTNLDDLGLALDKLHVPYTFSFILVSSARYIPVVIWEVQDIIDAYKARGIELERSLLLKIRSYATMLVPVVISTARRSLRMAEAMEARAFGYTKSRVRYRDIKLRSVDYGLIAGTIIVTLLSLLYQIYKTSIL